MNEKLHSAHCRPNSTSILAFALALVPSVAMAAPPAWWAWINTSTFTGCVPPAYAVRSFVDTPQAAERMMAERLRYSKSSLIHFVGSDGDEAVVVVTYQSPPSRARRFVGDSAFGTSLEACRAAEARAEALSPIIEDKNERVTK